MHACTHVEILGHVVHVHALATHTYMHACIHTYIHTAGSSVYSGSYIHTYIPYIYAMHAYIHTYIHT